MTASSELVARLRAWQDGTDGSPTRRLIADAASRIEHLERCRSELAEALGDLLGRCDQYDEADAPELLEQCRTTLSKCAPGAGEGVKP